MYNLLKANSNLEWANSAETAFQTLKDKLTSAPILAYPRFDRPFTFETDASIDGLGCVLSQEGDDELLHPVAFASRTLTVAERNYSITELECLAIAWSLQTFRPYAYGRPCRVIKDHQALKWLLSQASPSGQLNRWSLALQEYQLEVVCRPSCKNEKADALSRAPLVAALQSPTDDICTVQKKDSQSQMLAEYLESDLLPDDVAEHKEIKHLANQLELDHTGCLVHREPHRRQTSTGQPHIFVPGKLRLQILQAYHKSALGAHQGFLKTADRIKLKYYWPQLDRDVRHFVETCLECQQRKPVPPSVSVPHLNIKSWAPWDIIEVDVMELPLTENGNRYVVAFIDHFMKFIEAFATADQRAETIAKLFFKEIICRYGAPESCCRTVEDVSCLLWSRIFANSCL